MHLCAKSVSQGTQNKSARLDDCKMMIDDDLKGWGNHSLVLLFLLLCVDNTDMFCVGL